MITEEIDEQKKDKAKSAIENAEFRYGNRWGCLYFQKIGQIQRFRIALMPET